jgi:hypothetical protein
MSRRLREIQTGEVRSQSTLRVNLMLKHRSIFVLFITSLISVCDSSVSAREEPQPAKLSIDSIAQGVADYYRRIHELKGLHLVYEMAVENRFPGQSAAFGWMNVKGEHKIQGTKSYYRVTADPWINNSSDLNDTFTWDDRIGMWDMDSRLFDIEPNMLPRHAMFAFLLQALYFEREIDVTNDGSPIDYKTQTDDYALPVCLLMNKASYHVLPNLEVVGGVACHVVERPGYDKIWVDAEHGFCLMKREFRFRPSGSLREIVEYSNHRPIRSGLFFPRAIVKDLFGPPGNAIDSGKVCCRFVFDVKTADEEEIDDAIFTSLKPAIGAGIYDGRTQTRSVRMGRMGVRIAKSLRYLKSKGISFDRFALPREITATIVVLFLTASTIYARRRFPKRSSKPLSKF